MTDIQIPVKALSIKHPYALAVVMGEKKVELRTWNTDFRGVLFIVAARMYNAQFVKDFAQAVGEPELADVCTRTAGHVIGLTYLDDCRPAEASDAETALTKVPPNHFAFNFKDAMQFQGSIPIRIRQGLFDLTPDEEKLFRKVGYWLMVESFYKRMTSDPNLTWDF